MTLLSNQFNIQIVNAPPHHSTSNGQVERFHSTLAEIARCLKIERGIKDTVELILLATIEYNKSIYSVINKRPIDEIHSSTIELNTEIRDKVLNAQSIQIERLNKTRQDRNFHVGDWVLVKSNKKLGNKLSNLYSEEIIEADLGTTVLIKGRVVHKDNLK